MSTSLNPVLRRLGWGLVFQIIDIHIVFFDLLPDFIGYIMMASALHKLSTEHYLFRRAMWVATAMIFLSLPGVVMKSNIAISDFASIPLSQHLYSQAMLALHVLLAFWIFNGLYAIAQQAGDSHLLDSIINRRNLYLVIFITQLIVYPFFLNVDDSWLTLFIVFGILGLIMELMFIRLPFRLAKVISRAPLVR
ncbi:MAG: hypothetical protein ACQEXQ_26485 [Bacillota bacterium]